MSGKTIPLDPEPSPKGNVQLLGSGARVLSAAAADDARSLGEPLYLSHYATCDNPERFRKA